MARPDSAMRLLSYIPEHFRWTFHNVVAHPVSEIVHLVGLGRLSDWIHDSTIPPHERTERGPDGAA